MAETPCSRTSTPAVTLRATVSPIKLAIEPPLTKVPLALAGNPSISLHQSTTCPSSNAAAWLPPPRLDPWTAARKSPSAPVKLPDPIYQAQKRGWMLPIG
jgi:hypothetical protein